MSPPVELSLSYLWCIYHSTFSIRHTSSCTTLFLHSHSLPHLPSLHCLDCSEVRKHTVIIVGSLVLPPCHWAFVEEKRKIDKERWSKARKFYQLYSKIDFTSNSIWASQLLPPSSKSPSSGLLQQPVSLIVLLSVLPCLAHPPYSRQSNLSENHIRSYYFSDKIFQGLTLTRATTRKRSSRAILPLQSHLAWCFS